MQVSYTHVHELTNLLNGNFCTAKTRTFRSRRDSLEAKEQCLTALSEAVCESCGGLQ